MESIVAGVHELSGYSRSFIIDGDDGVTLVDTGLPKRDGAIFNVLASIGRSLEDVRAIAITHAHVDHFGSAAVLKQKTDALLFSSAVDAAAIRGAEATPHPLFLDRLPFLKPVFRLMPGADPVEVDHMVGEGADGALPEGLTVIDTPGHTPGHVSFLLDRAGGALFVGDAAVATKRGEIKRGFMNRSTPTFDASLRHIAEVEFDVALFGHSSPLKSSAVGAFRRFVDTSL